MKKLWVLILLLLAGCATETTSTTETMYTEDELQQAVGEAVEEASDEIRQEGYDEGYDIGFEEGYDEGYEIGNKEGYAEGMEVGMSESPSEPSSGSPPSFSSSGLNLYSDGLDWSTATSFDKKEFVRSYADTADTTIMISEYDDYVKAIDIYYSSNSSLDTLNDVIKEISGEL